jgi:hypothetical protein
MPRGPGLPWRWVVSPLDPLGLGAPRGVPPAVGLFSLSDVLLVARGACPARLLAERKRTSSSRPGKGRSGPSEDHARLLQMASRRFPGLHVAGKAYLELPFPRALVRARPDLLLVGGEPGGGHQKGEGPRPGEPARPGARPGRLRPEERAHAPPLPGPTRGHPLGGAHPPRPRGPGAPRSAGPGRGGPVGEEAGPGPQLRGLPPPPRVPRPGHLEGPGGGGGRSGSPPPHPGILPWEPQWRRPRPGSGTGYGLY